MIIYFLFFMRLMDNFYFRGYRIVFFMECIEHKIAMNLNKKMSITIKIFFMN